MHNLLISLMFISATAGNTTSKGWWNIYVSLASHLSSNVLCRLVGWVAWYRHLQHAH